MKKFNYDSLSKNQLYMHDVLFKVFKCIINSINLDLLGLSVLKYQFFKTRIKEMRIKLQSIYCVQLYATLVFPQKTFLRKNLPPQKLEQNEHESRGN